MNECDGANLEEVLCEIEAHHKAVLAGKRQSIERAILAGERLEQIKRRIGHNEHGFWVTTHSTLKLSTARLYHRLYRRLADMPDMKERVLALTLNEADAALAQEREQRMFREGVRNHALNSALCETAQELADVINLAKKRLGEEAWAAWDDPIARFVKPLAEPPKALCFPAQSKRSDESVELDDAFDGSGGEATASNG
jgi:hypothetical protein